MCVCVWLVYLVGARPICHHRTDVQGGADRADGQREGRVVRHGIDGLAVWGEGVGE